MRSLRRPLTLIMIAILFFAGGIGLARVWRRYEMAMAPEPPAPPAPEPQTPVGGGPLKVVRVYPEPGEVGVMRWSRLQLFFNRPVSEAALEAGLVISPPLQMRFEPYGENGWAATPVTGWTEGRLYSIKLTSQLAAASGAQLDTELSWSFRTAALPVPEDTESLGAIWDATVGMTAPVWSPDGARIAVVKRGQDRFDWQLIVIDPATKKQTLVGPADPVAPLWVDNTRIIVSARGTQPGASIELRQYDLARDIYRILASPTDLRQYAFSVSPHRAPAGGWLLEVNQGGIDAHSDVQQSLVVLSSGGGARWLDDPAGTKWFLGWDESGRAVILNTFANYDNSHCFRYDIMAWDPGSGALTTLAGDGPIASFGGSAQQGDEVAIWTWNAVDTGYSIIHRPARLLRYRIKDSELLDLKPQSQQPGGSGPDAAPMPRCTEDCWPSWSPDGSLVAFASNRGGSWDIWTMKADGSDARRLTTDDGEDTHPAWSPDGETIAFLSTRAGARQVWLMDADGGNQRPAK